jgi:GNAT superfamily N-acetyltransferase
MRDVERLLTAASVEITAVDPEHRDARYCLAEYAAELNRRSDRGFDQAVGATALPHEVRPPAGQFFVIYLRGEPIGCGAVKHNPGAPTEIKRMWIAPAARGLGLGRRLLEDLEACALASGVRVARIERARSSPRRSPSTARPAGSRSRRSTTSRSPTTGSRKRSPSSPAPSLGPPAPAGASHIITSLSIPQLLGQLGVSPF